MSFEPAKTRWTDHGSVGWWSQTPRDPAVFTSPRPPTAPSPGSRPRTSESPRRGSKSAKGKSLTSDLAALVAEVRYTQLILPTAPGVSNEGQSSPLLVPLPPFF